MIKKNIELYWQPLINITDVSFPKKDKRGIYLWGFQIKNNFVPYYVGIADAIFHRMMEHVSYIISGKYTIYHQDSLADFAKYKSEMLNETSEHGKIFRPNWSKGYVTFLKKRQQLEPHINFMVNNLAFSCANVDDSTTKSDLKEIEKFCIDQIGMDNLQNSRCGNHYCLDVKHEGDIELVEIFNSVKS